VSTEVKISPSEASSFIKFDQTEGRFSVKKGSKLEFIGTVTISVKLVAYTDEKVPRLREKKGSF
jgi:hypothetical protein